MTEMTRKASKSPTKKSREAQMIQESVKGNFQQQIKAARESFMTHWLEETQLASAVRGGVVEAKDPIRVNLETTMRSNFGGDNQSSH